MTIIRDLREFIESLNIARVQYFIVGGWAVNNYLVLGLQATLILSRFSWKRTFS
jgi:hypothetical protein